MSVEQAERRLAAHDHRDAIDLLRDALTENPDDATAHAVLALALLAGKRVTAALAEARAALALDGGSAYAHYAMAAALHASSGGRANNEAWRHCQVALTSDVESVLDDIDVGVAVLGAEIRMARANDNDAARELLLAIIARFPTHEEPRIALARIELAAGRPADAARHAAEAVRHHPRSVAAHVVTGEIALSRADVAAAERSARIALDRDRNDRDALALWTRIKSRRSRVIGAWWRWSTWMAARADDHHVGTLIVTFLLVQLAMVLANAAGLPGVQAWLLWGWAAFCIYSWYAPTLLEHMLARDLGAGAKT